MDMVSQTVLHHASKRNHFKLVRILIQRGAQVDKQDIIGRTALFLAVQLDNLRSIKALLAGKAKPGKINNKGQNAIDVCKTLQVKGLLLKAHLLSITIPLVPYKDRDRVWKSEGYKFFHNDDDHVTVMDFL